MGGERDDEVGRHHSDDGGEGRFRTLTEHARDSIVEIREDGRYLYVSPGFTELFGWRPEEVVGRNALEWVHPEDLSSVDAIRVTAFAEELPVDILFRFRHRNGAWRWVELSGRPYRTEAGELRAVLVSRDVTARIEAERALQQQLEAERRIFELSRRFLNVSPGDFEACLREGLAAAGGIARADRAQFYLMNRFATGIGGHFLWSAPGVSPHEPERMPEALDRFRWGAWKLLRGDVVQVSRLADLPPEAERERQGLEERGVRSYLALPVIHEGSTIGFLDFFRVREEKGWSEQEVTRLGLLTEVLSSAVRRLHAEQARRATEERFRTLTRHIRDTLCELSLDGELLSISDNYEALCGYTRADLAGIDLWSLVHPEDRERVLRDTERGVESGEARLSYRIRHRDGSWRWIEATLNLFSTASGERRLAVVARDVTDREQQRMELERQLEVEKRVADFSRALLESGADAIDTGIEHGLEAAAGLAGADRAFLVSSLGGEAGQATVYDWHAPEVTPRIHPLGIGNDKQRWILSRLLRGEVVRVPRVEDLPDEAREIRDSLIEGGIRSYLCLPITGQDRLLGVVGFHCLTQPRDWSDRDVTLLRLVIDLFTSALRRKGAEVSLEESRHRLLQAQKMEAVGTLAGGIAHDFNNQLTVMLANARFALRRAEGDEELREALGDLHRAAEHCAQLTRSLLAFSRRTPVSPRSLEVSEVAAEAEELLRPLIPSSIRFDVQARDCAARIAADPVQLQQVLVNLVVNARDAMPAGGHLLLRAAPREVEAADAARLGLAAPGAYVEFVVRDTGTGMDPMTQERIFEPFFTTKPMGEGTGLGLATAYGIVEQCGGSISVESEPRRGSTFRVLLPLCQDAASESTGTETDETSSGGGCVLLVEDEPSVRRLLGRMLRRAGYEVLEAADGGEGLRLGRQNEDGLDALLTDVDMPGLSGIDLARRLTRQRPDLPVLFISGTAQEGLDPNGPGTPARRSAFLGKPFSENALLQKLRELLATT